MTERAYMTKAQVVEYTTLSIATIDRMMKAGTLKFGKVGRKVFLRKRDVDAFMASRVVKK